MASFNKMKISILMRYANPPAGGAENSLLTLAKLLSKAHDIQLISLGYKNQETFYQSIPIKEIRFRDMVYDGPLTIREMHKKKIINSKIADKVIPLISNHSPDIIISQHEAAFIVPMYKKYSNKIFRWIHMINGLEYTKFQEPTSSLDYFLRKIFGRYLETLTIKIIREADRVIFPSEYLMNKYPKKYASKYDIVSPFISLKRFLAVNNNSKGKILHIKGTKSKGIEITLELAKKFPKEKFIICGKIEEKYLKKISELFNVQLTGYSPMESIYEQSKLLLVPTLNGETFSISAVEAQAAGLNVLINKGGIPAPKDSFVNSISLSKWNNALKGGGNRLQRTQLKRYDCNYQYKKFIKIIEDMI